MDYRKHKKQWDKLPRWMQEALSEAPEESLSQSDHGRSVKPITKGTQSKPFDIQVTQL